MEAKVVRLKTEWGIVGDEEVPIITGIPDHPTIKAIFFDLDGVLVDAADWHKDAFNSAMLRFDADPLSEEEHHKVYNGLSTRKKLELLIAAGRFSGYWVANEQFIDLFYAEKQNFTIKTIMERCKPNERVLEAVNFAYQQNYRLAVVTNCSRFTCELMMKLSDLEGFFEFIIANEDVQGSVKPSPRPYLEAKWKMNLRDKEFLAIDDTKKGIMSAMEAFGRTWKLEKFEDLTSENLTKALDKYRITL